MGALEQNKGKFCGISQMFLSDWRRRQSSPTEHHGSHMLECTEFGEFPCIQKGMETSSYHISSTCLLVEDKTLGV